MYGVNVILQVDHLCEYEIGLFTCLSARLVSWLIGLLVDWLIDQLVATIQKPGTREK